MTLAGWMRDVSDLVLGRACLVCCSPGPSLCSACLTSVRSRPPAPVFIGDREWGQHLRLHHSVAYRGLGRALILRYKEYGDRSLARPLGRLLADAVRADPSYRMGELRAGIITVVPIPAHRHARRGFDALGAVTRQAQRDLAAEGTAVRIVPALVPARSTRQDHVPLKRLGRRERSRAVHLSLAADERALDLITDGPIVIVDDVVTTGATMLEAARALAAAGAPASGAAAVSHHGDCPQPG